MKPFTFVALWVLTVGHSAMAVMFNRDTGDAKSQELAKLQPFTSRANLNGCTAVLIAPNVILSAAHCVSYAASGTTTVYWNGQTRTAAPFTRIGDDHLLIITDTPFTGTFGKMTAPYAGSGELGKLAWKVATGGHGIIGTGGSGADYSDQFSRAMTTRIEVNTVNLPPAVVGTDYLYYDFDGPPSKVMPGRGATTYYEGGTAPGDSGGPLYMYENGRWFVIGVTSGPDNGFYRDARVRTDMTEIETLTGYSWARPTAPVLEMKWKAEDLVASVGNGGAVASWPRQGGADAWSDAAGNGGVGVATLAHAVTPLGTAAIEFPGTARLALPAAANPLSGKTAFTVAMVVRADAAGDGAEASWGANTGLLDADETGSVNDWGLAISSTGKVGLGVGNADTTNYSAGSSLVDGQWHVVVATWDGSEVTGDAVGLDQNMSVYVDGVANVSRKQGAEFLNVARNAASLTLGGSRGASRFFDGAVAEVRLYRGALEPKAVDSLIWELKNAHITAATPPVSLGVSEPWAVQNIGDATTAGAQTFGGNTASLTGSGKGLEEVSDSIRMAWKPLTGNGSVTARVTGFTATNAGKASGGIMLRSSLDREATNAALSVTSGGGLSFTRRFEEAGYTEPTLYTLKAPYWLRLKRVGNEFTAYRSPDGVTWELQGAPTSIATMPASAVWGLAVSGNINTTFSEVKVDNVLLQPLAGQAAPGNVWVGNDIGAPGVAGTNALAGSVYTLKGSGLDIGGVSDQFYHFSQVYVGDAQLTARVVSQDPSSPLAKAGVMVRASNAAGAENAFVGVTAKDGIPFQVRSVSAGPTVSDATGTRGFTAPYWLRLVRNGNSFSSFRSLDGVSWLQLGPAVILADAPPTMQAGLYVAPDNNAGNSVATFDSISVLQDSAVITPPVVELLAGQNPSSANGFTLMASADRAVTWSWQKISGPGVVTFKTQNTAMPQTAFSQPGTYVIRATAEAFGVSTSVDQTFDFSLSARWDFNTAGNLEGWASVPEVASVAGGLLSATATNADPKISKAGIYVSGDLAKRVLIRYRASVTGGTQLFWGRSGSEGFAAAKSVVLSYPAANVWTGLTLNPAASADWIGQLITGLRFDPAGVAGSTYDIDWIALSDGNADVAAYEFWVSNFPTLADTDPDADPDGDGWSNHGEWLAGTDPTAPLSRFTTTMDGANLTFTRMAGRTYRVETSSTLGNDWVLHTTVAAGSGPVSVPYSTVGDAKRFYRVVISSAP